MIFLNSNIDIPERKKGMVRVMLIHCFRAALLILFSIGLVTHVSANSQKTMPAQVQLKINWDIDDDYINRKGSFSMQVGGTLNLNPLSAQTAAGKAITPVSLQYSSENLAGSYNYQETITENESKSCSSAMLSTHEGSGMISTSRGRMQVQRIKHLASAYLDKLNPIQKQFLAQMPGQELLVDFYDFGCIAPGRFIVSGQSRGGDCKYKNSEKKISLGTISLGFKIPSSGMMKGSRNWQANPKTFESIFNVGLSDLPDEMELPSYKPSNSPGGDVSYSVTWAFGDAALKPLKCEVSTVSFKYDSQNDRSLQLWNHGLSPWHVEAPEWTSDGVNEPAAFVLDHLFRVKAVFDCPRPVKSAKIRVNEKVLLGRGFGGELTQIGDLTISGRQISGEFVIKTPQKKIGTHQIIWQWEGDVEFEDEPGKINVKFGESEHTIYIVGGIPTGNALAYKHAVKLGCKWAEGTKGGDETFGKIWSNFWNIPAPHGGTLSYEHGKGFIGTTNALLHNSMGVCGAWADFLKDTVGIHGIKISKIGIYPINAGISIPGEISFDTIVVKKDAPAQGNSDPCRVFTEHVINKYNGNYYDPSYKYDGAGNLSDYENKLFIGYCRIPEVLGLIPEKSKEMCPQVAYPNERPNEAEFADCLLEIDDETACVPNRYDRCEVDEFEL